MDDREAPDDTEAAMLPLLDGEEGPTGGWPEIDWDGNETVTTIEDFKADLASKIASMSREEFEREYLSPSQAKAREWLEARARSFDERRVVYSAIVAELKR